MRGQTEMGRGGDTRATRYRHNKDLHLATKNNLGRGVVFIFQPLVTKDQNIPKTMESQVTIYVIGEGKILSVSYDCRARVVGGHCG